MKSTDMENPNGSKEIKKKDWSIVYSPDIEKYRSEYKNIISTMQKVLEGEEVEGVEVERINEETKGQREYFVFKIGGEDFFVKKMTNYNQGGVGEFNAGKIVESRLAAYGLEKVKVINYVFAYTDNNTRYTVSKYDKNAEKTLAEYVAQLRVDGKYDECTRLNTRLGEIRLHFPEYDDLRGGNMGYDPESDTIILFDLNLKSDSLIESSDDEL